jgi:hypothetical protein
MASGHATAVPAGMSIAAPTWVAIRDMERPFDRNMPRTSIIEPIRYARNFATQNSH